MVGCWMVAGVWSFEPVDVLGTASAPLVKVKVPLGAIHSIRQTT